jgi:hypothetical protein
MLKATMSEKDQLRNNTKLDIIRKIYTNLHDVGHHRQSSNGRILEKKRGSIKCLKVNLSNPTSSHVVNYGSHSTINFN